MPLSKPKPYKFSVKALDSETALTLKPKKIGAILKMAVLLGLLSPQFYEIYNICDGVKDIKSIAAELKLQEDQAKVFMDKLAKSKMIEF